MANLMNDIPLHSGAGLISQICPALDTPTGLVPFLRLLQVEQFNRRAGAQREGSKRHLGGQEDRPGYH